MSDLSSNVDWEKVQDHFIKNYPSITENDFEFENNDELMIHLQQKLGKTKEELREIIRKI